MIDNGQNCENEDEGRRMITDRELPLAFCDNMHTETIEGFEGIQQTWRMKERMKTVSVALVICLNVGVDPPDVVKTIPCARLECWLDPPSTTKALHTIGVALQKQYERWQPRARYKQSLDPTSEEIKKLCSSLRKSAKEERVLFHYNGHGVPKPTTNGEIWVFNRQYTQYIPLSIYDLQKWMGSPSIYVYDCSNAGIIVKSYNQFATQHETEIEKRGTAPMSPSYKNCIQLAACDEEQSLPMNPDLPADLFTSCLTTPIKTATRYYVLQATSKLVPKINLELLDRIPGVFADRRTMLGELNWIFTAITDTIAWNTLPRDLFQKLFRQDLLVASLFRNFLLAERIMRSYDCTPISDPELPETHQHPMWEAWDLTLDLSLGQLPKILQNNEPFVPLPFFEEQLTAFEVWLNLGKHADREPPEQLPIVLQVLLSQVHRMRALELLGKFLDLGPWAVNLALSVGIFPYVLKLLQSCAKELRPLLVFIWAKILAVDDSCQSDLVRDTGHKYFVQVLQDLAVPSESRTQAAFVLACIVNKCPDGQEVCVQANLVSICLEQLSDPNPNLRQWLAICLGRLWDHYEKARWTGVRDTAHEKLYSLLHDPVPEVRAAAVYALGTFVNSVKNRTEHANNIDHSVIMTLIKVSSDMSILVRKELIVAIQWLILAFENTFINVASQEATVQGPREHTGNPIIKRAASREHLKPTPVGIDAVDCRSERIKRVSSTSSISMIGNLNVPGLSFGSIYMKCWAGLCSLESDPYPEVAKMATTVTSYIRNQVTKPILPKDSTDGKYGSSMSLPPSPNRSSYLSDSPPTLHPDINKYGRSTLPSHGKRFHPTLTSNTISEREVKDYTKKILVTTQFVAWACKQFAQRMNKNNNVMEDKESREHYEQEWRFIRNDAVRKEGEDERRRSPSLKIEYQQFSGRLPGPLPVSVLQFHPYDQHVAVVLSDSVVIWDWGAGAKLSYSSYRTSKNPSTHITSLEWINAFDVGLMMVAYNDGSVRVWRPSGSSKEPSLITAWQAFNDLSASKKFATNKVLLMWEQWTQTVITGGDSKLLRVWDAQKEMHAYDIQTGSECPITCVDSTYTSVAHEQHALDDPADEDDGLVMGGGDADEIDGSCRSRQQKGLIVVGCANGAVRLFDRRCAPNDTKIKAWRDHSGSILGVQLRGDKVISGCTNGEVKIFDIRSGNGPWSVHQAGQQMSAFAVHRLANMYSCANGQNITQFTMQGLPINTIRFSEGFIGYRTGASVVSLTYHPYKLALAASTVDSSFCVYTADPNQARPR